jgi:phosphatidylinositol-3,4,5-trisphosphate 3-phosphatase/dual-specificity protein phosphatase PTEN
MNLLREYVGGPKNRYKDEKFNLDLTYITPRLIAMAFPASGF